MAITKKAVKTVFVHCFAPGEQLYPSPLPKSSPLLKNEKKQAENLKIKNILKNWKQLLNILMVFPVPAFFALRGGALPASNFTPAAGKKRILTTIPGRRP